MANLLYPAVCLGVTDSCITLTSQVKHCLYCETYSEAMLHFEDFVQSTSLQK